MQVFQIVSTSLADMKRATNMVVFMILEYKILLVGIEPHASVLIQSQCRRLREIALIRTREVFEQDKVTIITKVYVNINMPAYCKQDNFWCVMLHVYFSSCTVHGVTQDMF